MNMAKQQNEFIEICLIEKVDIDNYSVEEILNTLNLEGETSEQLYVYSRFIKNGQPWSPVVTSCQQL